MIIYEPNEIPQSGNIVLAGGCFDILHLGHIDFLREAKAFGDLLVILLEHDDRITKMKGPSRPINKQKVRAQNLIKHTETDIVFMLEDHSNSDYYASLVKAIHPKVIAITKGDPNQARKESQAKLVNARVIEAIDLNPNYSTTKSLYKFI